MPFIKGEQPLGSIPFKKGEPSPNPLGRRKNIKSRIEKLISTNLDIIESAMETATPVERINMVLGLSKLM
ncbi:hypothetical protein ACFOWA_19965 [Pedobacter lithocola]|uniref:DUF5681 domain-containing protein n=1 Tax=Pedobacter lithocola TaxID=1908239 RepID=A0ABV8PDU0_9SPHI